MSSQPAPPLRPEYTRLPAAKTPAPAARTGGKRSGCLDFLRWYVTGFVLGWLAFFALLLIVNRLFPPTPANILVLGLDRRPGESLVSRTDTMILTRINPSTPAIAMLSLPRDLWVTLPGGGKNRINTAHRFAENDQPGSGPAVAMETVEINFGVPVDYYVRLDFEGFVQIIDAVGGITIEVESTFVDYQYPTYNGGTQVVTFEAGVQHMDGERALQYARIRHGSSDFVRAGRQQQIVAAFVARLLQPSVWVRFPVLLQAVNAAVDTDIGPLAAARLAPTIFAVGPEGITRQVIEGAMVQPYRTPGGAAVQLPVWEQIDPVLREHFGK